VDVVQLVTQDGKEFIHINVVKDVQPTHLQQTK
jgi:hypothetical protein